MTRPVPRPSGLGRIVGCPGSWSVVPDDVEQEDSPAAIEGTIAHEVAAARLKGETLDNPDITHEMIVGAEEWFNFCTGHSNTEVLIEEKVDVPIWHDMIGTPDFMSYDSKTKTLRVYDYKFGFKPVGVEKNAQLHAYAAAGGSMFPETQTVVFGICQPRINNIVEKESPALEVRDFIRDIRAAVTEAVRAESPTFKAGPHCYKCLHAASCKTLEAANLSLYDLLADQPENTSPQEVPYRYELLLQAQRMLTDQITAIEELITHNIETNGFSYGYGLKPGRGTTRWKSFVTPETAELLLGPSFTKKVLVNITEARSLSTKDKVALKKIMEDLTEKIAGKPKLEKLNLKNFEKVQK